MLGTAAATSRHTSQTMSLLQCSGHQLQPPRSPTQIQSFLVQQLPEAESLPLATNYVLPVVPTADSSCKAAAWVAKRPVDARA
jgi:hypothetical protein